MNSMSRNIYNDELNSASRGVDVGVEIDTDDNMAVGIDANVGVDMIENLDGPNTSK